MLTPQPICARHGRLAANNQNRTPGLDTPHHHKRGRHHQVTACTPSLPPPHTQALALATLSCPCVALRDARSRCDRTPPRVHGHTPTPMTQPELEFALAPKRAPKHVCRVLRVRKRPQPPAAAGYAVASAGAAAGAAAAFLPAAAAGAALAAACFAAALFASSSSMCTYRRSMSACDVV